ncbi:pimeloyl-ACP methyl ester carboxylesterase [Mycobacterium sp. BK558]|nr:pimeloyl-ACP methyl ester carboxylesterase [Mycobacterium sp. BK558]
MSTMVATPLGRLHVTDVGAGPVAMFWHSLFVDQASWRLVIDALGPDRRVLLVDAPNHGRSDAVDRDFTIDDCAVAAAAVLDQLGITEPVDWVGNALGGHIGITFAARRPDRVRTLVTIGTPVEGFGAVEKWTRIVPLVQLYRIFGPAAVDRLLTTALLGSEAIAAQPDQACTTMAAFQSADRHAMLRAMRCLMVRRRSLRHEIERITCPTLLLVAEGGQEGWSPRESAAVARRMDNAVSETLPGAGNIAPLLLAPELVAERLQRFWESAS